MVVGEGYGLVVSCVSVADNPNARVGRKHALQAPLASSVPSATTTMPACCE